MAVRLSALNAGRSLHPGRFLVLISVRGCVDPRTTVRLTVTSMQTNPDTEYEHLPIPELQYAYTI
jgi:hypothetical protein